MTERAPKDDALVVMARYPQPGEVKSRLAATLGEEAAARMYRAFLADIGERFGADPRWIMHWAFDPPESRFADEIAGAVLAFPQVAGDLGVRMAGAIRHLLGCGYRRVVLIGSDVPHLPREAVARAFDELAAGAELVLVPVDDGGYCLIGAASVPPVFDGVEWGKSDVLEVTVRLASRHGIVPSLLAATYDVDDARGLERLSEDLAAGRVERLPETTRALERAATVLYK